MLKWVLVVTAVVAVFWLYGWRIHPDAFGTSRPVVTHEPKKNVIAKWRPEDMLDRFNGEREYKMRVQAQKG